MPVEIQRYLPEMVPAVQALNGRLREAGISWQFPEYHAPRRLLKEHNLGIYQEHFLAVEGNQVRGGYILKHQQFSFRGKMVHGAFCRLPMSEGIINRKYGLVGVQVVRDALKRQPFLMSTGMGGSDSAYPKLLKSLGWKLHTIPFFFKARRPFRMLRGLVYLRDSPWRKLLLDLAAGTGLGWVGLQAMQKIGRRAVPEADATEWELVPRFAGWTDDLWQVCRDKYAMVAERNSTVLGALYAEDSPRFLRLKISERGRAIGWALVLDTQMSGHKQFGDLRVGSIADALALPEKAHQVVWAATRFLEDRNVDLLVSTQSHAAWCAALKACGYLKGPSNFVLGMSPEGVRLLDPFASNKDALHVNRGDGDGPIHL